MLSYLRVACVGLLILMGLIKDTKSLKNVHLTIEPKVVQRFNSSTLTCSYQLDQNEELYTVKWYRGTLEFYRYTANEVPNVKTFLKGGIKVDKASSNSTQVVLTHIEFNLSGNFSCEVTTEARDAPFTTAVDMQSMLVVQLPENPPKISVGREPLDYGDVLRANCSSPPSRPPALLQFSLNNYTVARSKPLNNLRATESRWSDLALELVLNELHFHNGQLILRCEAFVEGIYHEVAELQVDSAREPIPERVSAVDSANRVSIRVILQLQLMLFCYMMLYNS